MIDVHTNTRLRMRIQGIGKPNAAQYNAGSEIGWCKQSHNLQTCQGGKDFRVYGTRRKPYGRRGGTRKGIRYASQAGGVNGKCKHFTIGNTAGHADFTGPN